MSPLKQNVLETEIKSNIISQNTPSEVEISLGVTVRSQYFTINHEVSDTSNYEQNFSFYVVLIDE